jgi:hypothetical protein
MVLTMMERVGDRWGKNGRILFDRPKPTAGCSGSGIIIIIIIIIIIMVAYLFKEFPPP